MRSDRPRGHDGVSRRSRAGATEADAGRPARARRADGGDGAALWPLLAVVGCALTGCLGGASRPDTMHVRCMEPIAAGICAAPAPGFRYDFHTDTCQRFMDGGCGGARPFKTMQSCVATCGGQPR